MPTWVQSPGTQTVQNFGKHAAEPRVPNSMVVRVRVRVWVRVGFDT